MSETKKTKTQARRELLAPCTIGLDPDVIKRTADLAPNPRTASAIEVIKFWARQGLTIPAIAAKCGLDDVTFLAKLDAIDEDGKRPFRQAYQMARAELEADLRIKLNHMAATTDSEKTRLAILRDQLLEIQRDNQIRPQATMPDTSSDFDYEDVEIIPKEQPNEGSED